MIMKSIEGVLWDSNPGPQDVADVSWPPNEV